MTVALFLNTKIRSSRHVLVQLGDAGIEINHTNGDRIVLWPYDAVGRAFDEPPRTHQFFLGTNLVTLLQIKNPAIAQQIIARSPLAQGSRWGRILKIIWSVINEDRGTTSKVNQWNILAWILILIGAGFWQARHWLSEFWQSFVGG